jgi:protein-S-isoprenylcysteine O-methyltransferase Ste14
MKTESEPAPTGAEASPSQTAPERNERPGAAYFRWRGWIPIPLYVAIIALPWRSSRVWETLAAGMGILLLGCVFRLWAIRHIGHRARTHSQKTRPLVDTGPYAAVRNPLYIANILIASGFALATGLHWYAPLLACLLLLHYHLVVRCEEAGLLERHPQAYAEYQAKTPRWFPLFFRKNVWVRPNFTLGESLYREKSGILGVGLGIGMVVVWAWWRTRS